MKVEPGHITEFVDYLWEHTSQEEYRHFPDPRQHFRNNWYRWIAPDYEHHASMVVTYKEEAMSVIRPYKIWLKEQEDDWITEEELQAISI